MGINQDASFESSWYNRYLFAGSGLELEKRVLQSPTVLQRNKPRRKSNRLLHSVNPFDVDVDIDMTDNSSPIKPGTCFYDGKLGECNSRSASNFLPEEESAGNDPDEEELNRRIAILDKKMQSIEVESNGLRFKTQKKVRNEEEVMIRKVKPEGNETATVTAADPLLEMFASNFDLSKVSRQAKEKLPKKSKPVPTFDSKDTYEASPVDFDDIEILKTLALHELESFGCLR